MSKTLFPDQGIKEEDEEDLALLEKMQAIQDHHQNMA
jgi:hypothetical protein